VRGAGLSTNYSKWTTIQQPPAPLTASAGSPNELSQFPPSVILEEMLIGLSVSAKVVLELVETERVRSESQLMDLHSSLHSVLSIYSIL
jgi:hypothetical protein